jgi:hypothetical protein
VSRNGKYITVDALVENQERIDGWVRAIKELQDAARKTFAQD